MKLLQIYKGISAENSNKGSFVLQHLFPITTFPPANINAEILIISLMCAFYFSIYITTFLGITPAHISSSSSAAYVSMTWYSVGSDNDLSPLQPWAITWTNAGLLSTGPSGTKFSEIQIKIQNFSFAKMHLKMLSVKWRPFCPGREELIRLA